MTPRQIEIPRPKRPSQTERLQAAAEVAAIAGAAGALSEVLAQAATRVAPLLEADWVSVRLYDHTTQRLVLHSSAGPRAPRATHDLAPGQGLSGTTLSTGKPVLTNHLSAFADEWPELRDLTQRPGLAVPLRVGMRVIGTLAAVGRPSARYSDNDVAVLDLVGRVLSAGVSRIEALEAARRRAERLETLHETAAALAQESDPHAALQLIGARARCLLSAERAVVRLWQSDAQRLVVAAVDGETGEPPLERIRSGEGAAGQAFATGKPVLVDDYPTWPQALSSDLWAGRRSVLAVPLRLRDEPLGVLTVAATRIGAFTDEDAQLMTLFAQQAATAFAQARALAEQRRAAEYAERLAVLHALALEVVQQSDEHQVLHHTVEAASQLLGGEVARLWLLEATTDELVLRAAYGSELLPLATRYPRAARPLIERALRTREVIAVDDYPGHPSTIPELLAGGVASIILAPLVADKQAQGVLIVNALTPRTWTADDRQMLQLLARHAADALLSARRLAAERRTARLEAALRAARGVAASVGSPLEAAAGRVELLLRLSTLGERERAIAEEARAGLRAAVEALRRLHDAGHERA
ncbi:MAG: GAF domain-containing protein [Chloroflexi bacterium]|nr:GAF domain-containing protein [Chloroflexota bacterium]